MQKDGGEERQSRGKGCGWGWSEGLEGGRRKGWGRLRREGRQLDGIMGKGRGVEGKGGKGRGGKGGGGGWGRRREVGGRPEKHTVSSSRLLHCEAKGDEVGGREHLELVGRKHLEMWRTGIGRSSV